MRSEVGERKGVKGGNRQSFWLKIKRKLINIMKRKKKFEWGQKKFEWGQKKFEWGPRKNLNEDGKNLNEDIKNLNEDKTGEERQICSCECQQKSSKSC